MNIAKASSKLFGASTINSVLGFVGIAFFARELGASQMGVYYLFETVLGVLTLLVDFGLRGAVEKRVSEGQPGGEVLTTAFLMKLFLFAIVVIPLLLFRGIVNTYIGANVVFLLIVGVVLRELAETQQILLSGEQQAGQMAVPDTARQVGWVGIGGIFVLQGFGVVGIIYGLFVGYVMTFLLCWHRSVSSLARPSVERAKSLIEFTKYHAVSSIQSYVYSWVDVAIIGFFLPQAAVGAYETAWRVTEAAAVLGHSIAAAILPQISKWHAEGRTEKISNLVSDVTIPSLLLVIPALGGTLVLSREILTFTFGSEFVIASTALIILAGEKVIQAVYRILHRSLHGIDRPDLAARTIIATMVLNTILNLLLVRPFGIEGVAFATAISFLLGTAIYAWYFTRFVPVHPPVREIGWCVLSAILMAIGLNSIRMVFPVDSLATLLSLITVGGILYFLSVLAYSPLRIRLLSSVRQTLH